MRKIRESDMFIGSIIAFGGIIAGLPFPQLAQSSQNPLFAIASLGMIALGTFFALKKSQGMQRALLLMGAIGICALVIESIGVATGFPYSPFTYGNALGTKIGNLVPWTVGIAFPPLLFITHAIAEKYTSKPTRHVLLATALLVGVDLVLDPTLTALTYWSWENSGLYYGVPLQNFFGWTISGLAMHALCRYMWKPKQNNDLLIYAGIGVISFWTGAAGGFIFALPVYIGMLLCMCALYALTRK